MIAKATPGGLDTTRRPSKERVAACLTWMRAVRRDVRAQEVADGLGWAYATTKYALRELRQQGHIHICGWLQGPARAPAQVLRLGAGVDVERPAMPASRVQILEAASRHRGWFSAAQIAVRVCCSPSSVAHHLLQLCESGEVESGKFRRRPDGRSRERTFRVLRPKTGGGDFQPRDVEEGIVTAPPTPMSPWGNALRGFL